MKYFKIFRGAEFAELVERGESVQAALLWEGQGADSPAALNGAGLKHTEVFVGGSRFGSDLDQALQLEVDLCMSASPVICFTFLDRSRSLDLRDADDVEVFVREEFADAHRQRSMDEVWDLTDPDIEGLVEGVLPAATDEA
jgi:hypothetical protein